MELIRSGKVRDVYQDGDDVILVASDRVSVYDVVLPTSIPDKGTILTQLSLWWFAQMTDIVPNHIVSEEVPSEWAGRAVRCRALEILPLECIARGYLAGLGLDAYREGGRVSGVELPAGLLEGSKLPESIFTPSTKADGGAHDEHVSTVEAAKILGSARVEELASHTLSIYERGAAIANDRGVIVADTKFEFGLDSDGVVTLADELLTPDSSRFWRSDDWEPGRRQVAYDKQFVRDWSSSLGTWNRRAPGPEIPPDVVRETHNRYVEIFEVITGEKWTN